MYNNNGKIVATIEARMSSSRLPGKVLMEYCNISNLQHIIERLKRSKYVDDVVVATTVNDLDKPIIELCNKIGCNYFRGSEEDVLLRVLEAAKSVDGDLILEVTGDCPIVDWRYIDNLIELYFSKQCDYAANIIERTFPRGVDIQLFSVDILEKVNQITQNPADREHVSLYIYTHPEEFKLVNMFADEKVKYPELEITLDTQEDYELINLIYENLYHKNKDFSAEDAINLILNNKQLYNKAKAKSRKNPFAERQAFEL